MESIAHKTTFKIIFPIIGCSASFESTVKLVYNDHPLDSKFMAIVDRWSLFIGSIGL